MTMTREEIRENIINAIAILNENVIHTYNGNWYAAYITPDGEIYYGVEADMNTVPEAVRNGTDRIICKKQANENWGMGEYAKDDKYDLYFTRMSPEQKKEVSNYIESKKQEESEFYDGKFEPETLRDWSIDWIDKNYPEILQHVEYWIRGDIDTRIIRKFGKYKSEYEDIIEDLLDWCCDEDKEEL